MKNNNICLCVVLQINGHVNESKRREENMYKLGEIQKSIMGYNKQVLINISVFLGTIFPVLTS